MKQGLKLLAVYFGVMITLTILCTAIFMLYGNLTLFVAGREPVSNFRSFLYLGLIYSFPAACLMGSLMSILYFIRHKTSSILPFIFFLLANLITWGILLPHNLMRGTKYNSRTIEKKYEIVSEDYFRNENSGITYYTKITDDKKVSGIYIDINGKKSENNTKGEISRFENDDFQPAISALSFSDSLIENAVKLPEIVSFPLTLYVNVIATGLQVWQYGYIAWIFYAFIGIAFTACWGLKNIGKWKFLSAGTVVIVHALIMAINGLTKIPGSLQNLSVSVAQQWTALASTLPDSLSWLSSIKEPFLLALNIFFTIILSILGLAFYIIKKSSSRRQKIASIDEHDDGSNEDGEIL